MLALEPKTFAVDLPLTRLHVMEVGSGTPALLLPATISRLEDWQPLTQFIGQYYRTFFFELPGHGGSAPFAGAYSSDLTAQTIESLLDALEIDQVTLIGFSFGGILTMKTMHRIPERIKSLVLLAPCIGPTTLTYSPERQQLMHGLIRLLRQDWVQERFLALLHHPFWGRLAADIIIRLGNLEYPELLRHRLATLSRTTLDVLTCQMEEILTVQFPDLPLPYAQHCYLAMSVNDPILKFSHAYSFLTKAFQEVQLTLFTHPYHQPPRKLSLTDYNRQYGRLLRAIRDAEVGERIQWEVGRTANNAGPVGRTAL
ncbi:MAG: alpha/beta fold hydrolase [Anaerolineales bacterium]|nr:alpha/beta fold hydrolase [Anaerolineales bacterium]